MPEYESLPDFTSENPCPKCGELLHWSEHEHPPTVKFNTRTGRIGVPTFLPPKIPAKRSHRSRAKTAEEVKEAEAACMSGVGA
jgi:hypothetical protein